MLLQAMATTTDHDWTPPHLKHHALWRRIRLRTYASSKFLSLLLENAIDNLFYLPSQDIALGSRFCRSLRLQYEGPNSYNSASISTVLAVRIGSHLTSFFLIVLTIYDDGRKSSILPAGSGRPCSGLTHPRQRIEPTAKPGMDTQCMLEGFLVVPHFKELRTDAGEAGYSALDLCSPLGWRHKVLLTYRMIAFDWIKLNLVATLHTYVTLLRDPVYRP